MNRRELLRLLGLTSLAGAGGAPDVELTLTAAPAEVQVFPGAPTRVWRFTGTVVKGPAGLLLVSDSEEDALALPSGQRELQVWEFANTPNGMGMQVAHPIHMHGRQFRVLERTGGSASNALREGLSDIGWTDTVLVLPGETVLVQVPFTSYPGLYLYHCHILEHEDMGMMRNFRVV